MLLKTILNFVTDYKSFRFGKVFRVVKWIVEWGLEHRNLDDIESLGVDEFQILKGHHYATLMYQLDTGNKRLLGIEEGRSKESLEKFFKEFDADTEGEEQRSLKVKWVCSDNLTFNLV